MELDGVLGKRAWEGRDDREVKFPRIETENKIQQLFEAGRLALFQGNPKKACRLFMQIPVTPNSRSELYLGMQYEFINGDEDSALRHYASALGQHSLDGHFTANVCTGMIHVKQQIFHHAINYFQTALEAEGIPEEFRKIVKERLEHAQKMQAELIKRHAAICHVKT